MLPYAQVKVQKQGNGNPQAGGHLRDNGWLLPYLQQQDNNLVRFDINNSAIYQNEHQLKMCLPSGSSEIRMSLFLHQVCRNVSLHQCLSNGCSAVNGCRQNESLIKTSQFIAFSHVTGSKTWTSSVSQPQIFRSRLKRIKQRYI